MTARAEGSFTFDSWDGEDVSTIDGAHISRVVFVKRFVGAVSGTSRGWLTMVRHESGSAAYGGTERYDVTVDGRQGTFVAQHHAGGNETVGFTSSVEILDGSGTGELTGLRGNVEITAHEDGSHTVGLAYDLD